MDFVLDGDAHIFADPPYSEARKSYRKYTHTKISHPALFDALAPANNWTLTEGIEQYKSAREHGFKVEILYRQKSKAELLIHPN